MHWLSFFMADIGFGYGKMNKVIHRPGLQGAQSLLRENGQNKLFPCYVISAMLKTLQGNVLLWRKKPPILPLWEDRNLRGLNMSIKKYHGKFTTV